jgi:hypothetical protein
MKNLSAFTCLIFLLLGGCSCEDPKTTARTFFLEVEAEKMRAALRNESLNKAEKQKQREEIVNRLCARFPRLDNITSELLYGMFVDEPPKELGDFRYVGIHQTYYTGEEREEYFDGAIMPVETSGNFSFVEMRYANGQGQTQSVTIADRSGVCNWATIVRWIELKKGFIPDELKASVEYDDTIERDGREWVVWESKEDDSKIFTTLLAGRLEVTVRAEDLAVFEQLVPKERLYDVLPTELAKMVEMD